MNILKGLLIVGMLQESYKVNMLRGFYRVNILKAH